MDWIILLLLLALTILIAFFWLSLIRTSRSSAPYVATSGRMADRMVSLVQPQPHEKVVDLGSGDGSLVLAFSRVGCKAEGFEIQRLLVWWSRLRAHLTGVSGLAHFYRQDFWQVNCDAYDVVALYILPTMMGRMEEKLKAELRPGSRVVSYQFPFPHWPPSKVDGDIFVYQL